MDKKENAVLHRFRQNLAADETFHETEVQANALVSKILLCSGVFLALIAALTEFGVFPLSWETIFPPAIQGIVEIIILFVICRVVKNDAWWLGHLLMVCMVLVYARLDSMLTHKAAILMVLPVLCSARYFSRRLVVFTAVITTVCFFCSAAWGAVYGMINLNIVTMPAGKVITATGDFLGQAVKEAGVEDSMLVYNTLLYDYFPKWLMFFIATVISANIARRGREMVITQHKKDIEGARIASELKLANEIQTAMLPNIFPPFPERSEFDLFATMDPAREVGGDFYDYFLIDDDHLCLLMADVSGKGVPAALFMMASKIIFANNAMMGKSPAEILRDVNESICSKNPEEMFVTVWLGILEISTGKLTAANAGHEYPVIRQPDGTFALHKDKHGFVIGGMPGVPYKEYELTLAPGTRLFLYTDGVPEAADENGDMFGVERMLGALNGSDDLSARGVIGSVRKAVDGFIGKAEPFDDLTMMCLDYKGADRRREI